MPTLLAVMTPFPYQIDSEASLESARQLMAQHSIHHLAVTESGVLESIVSSRDIQASHFHNAQDDAGLTVGDVCPPRAYIADCHDPLDQILEAMATTHIGAVLVTRDGELVGIFTLQDACRMLAALLRTQHPDTPP
ncbi:MAG: CBS domain-containing protein, partial [Gammaproteobacteria bacterium]